MSILAGVDDIFVLQAEVMKMLASPRRLEILHLLADGPVEVSRLAHSMGVSQPNVSQHLALMRAAGVVEFERDGREVRYRLADPQIIEACDTMRCVLQRRLARMADLSELALVRPGNGSEATPSERAVPGDPPSTSTAPADPSPSPIEAASRDPWKTL